MGTYRPNIVQRTRSSAIIVSSYPPRECGIATFSKDVVDSLSRHRHVTTQIVAMEDSPDMWNYGPEVKRIVHRDSLASYYDAARWINHSPAALVNIQHEFGLFGGDAGEYLLHMLEAITKPIVITLHTVLPEPTPAMRRVVVRLSQLTNQLVVLSHQARVWLTTVYGIESHKITYIPHGVPDVPLLSTDPFKARLGLEGQRVVSTFGLLGPGKGLEHVIAAMPEVVRHDPSVIYLILGETHPGIRRREGERYRSRLQQEVASLGMSRNIRFVNHYLGFTELLDYLQATDVYVVPNQDPNQIVSGTLAYAMGCGRPIVSTPIAYAREMLSAGRGLLVGFHDPEGLSRSIIGLLSNETMRRQISQRAYATGRQMVWPAVAANYDDLFQRVIMAHRLAEVGPAIEMPARHAHFPYPAPSLLSQPGFEQTA